MKFPIITLLRKIWHSHGRHKTARIGAALSFYTFVSFFPLVLILLAVLGVALQLDLAPALDAQAYVIAYVTVNLPTSQALLVDNIADVRLNSTGLGLIGAVIGLWTASNTFAALDEIFDVIFEVERRRTWRSYARSRTMAVGVVLLLGLLLVTFLFISAFVRPAEVWLLAMPYGVPLLAGFNGVVALGISVTVFAMLYKVMPRRQVAWSAALTGGFFTAVTWQVARDILTWWLARSNNVLAGSVVGSVIAFLGLVYFGWQIVLLGAEVAANMSEPE